MKLQHKDYWDIYDHPIREGGAFHTLDWDKARKICEDNPGVKIYAGLAEDWTYTYGMIFDGEKRVRKGIEPCFSSNWATPVIVFNFDSDSYEHDDEVIECWYETPNFHMGYPATWEEVN